MFHTTLSAAVGYGFLRAHSLQPHGCQCIGLLRGRHRDGAPLPTSEAERSSRQKNAGRVRSLRGQHSDFFLGIAFCDAANMS